MLIKNSEGEKIRIDDDLAKFLGISRNLKTIPSVERLITPSTYFVYRDLVDPERNLINGKKSKLLAKFAIRGNAFEKFHYQTTDHQGFRDALTGQYVYSVTLPVKNEDGELFDFQGQPFHFELRIN